MSEGATQSAPLTRGLSCRWARCATAVRSCSGDQPSPMCSRPGSPKRPGRQWSAGTGLQGTCEHWSCRCPQPAAGRCRGGHVAWAGRCPPSPQFVVVAGTPGELGRVPRTPQDAGGTRRVGWPATMGCHAGPNVLPCGQWVSGSVEQWSSGAVKHPWLRDRVGKALVLGK